MDVEVPVLELVMVLAVLELVVTQDPHNAGQRTETSGSVHRGLAAARHSCGSSDTPLHSPGVTVAVVEDALDTVVAVVVVADVVDLVVVVLSVVTLETVLMVTVVTVLRDVLVTVVFDVDVADVVVLEIVVLVVAVLVDTVVFDETVVVETELAVVVVTDDLVRDENVVPVVSLVPVVADVTVVAVVAVLVVAVLVVLVSVFVVAVVGHESQRTGQRSCNVDPSTSFAHRAAGEEHAGSVSTSPLHVLLGVSVSVREVVVDAVVSVTIVTTASHESHKTRHCSCSFAPNTSLEHKCFTPKMHPGGSGSPLHVLGASAGTVSVAVVRVVSVTTVPVTVAWQVLQSTWHIRRISPPTKSFVQNDTGTVHRCGLSTCPLQR